MPTAFILTGIRLHMQWIYETSSFEEALIHKCHVYGCMIASFIWTQTQLNKDNPNNLKQDMKTHPESNRDSGKKTNHISASNAFRVLPERCISTDARVRVPAFPRSGSVSEHTPQSIVVSLVNPFESSRCRLTRVETPSSAAARSWMSLDRAG